VEEGQIMARAFMSELEKLAVGDGPMTPNTGAVKDPNQLHQVSTEDIQLGDVDKVTAILASLNAHVQDKAPGKIQVTGTEADKAANPADEKPLPADAMKAQQSAAAAAALNKKAADAIISNLYTKFFGKED
jgi:hypothetical protein